MPVRSQAVVPARVPMGVQVGGEDAPSPALTTTAAGRPDSATERILRAVGNPPPRPVSPAASTCRITDAPDRGRGSGPYRARWARGRARRWPGR